MNPMEHLRYTLLDKGVSADDCGVLRRGGPLPKRKYKKLDVDLAACGFSAEDQRDLFVVEFLPEPPPPLPAAAPKPPLKSKPGIISRVMGKD